MNITSSALERIEGCGASTVLPHTSYSGPAAERGTENHRRIQEAIDGGSWPEALADLGSKIGTVETEVAYVLDVATRTARRLGRLESHRDYGHLGPTEIATTLDLLMMVDGEAIIVDWKSRKRATPAERNPQILAQACAIEAYHGVSGWAGLIYLDNWERDLVAFSVLDSGARWSRLERIVSGAGKGDPRIGPWCEYCPALLSCPAQRRSMLALSAEEETLADMTPERIGELWTRLATIKAMADRVDEAIRLRARHEPIPLPNGKRLRLVESSRTSADVAAMERRLKDLGDDPSKYRKTTTYTQVREGK